MPHHPHDAEPFPGEPPVEERLERAALEASAEVGYWRLRVEEIIDRAGVSRPAFYRLYRNKTECFARAFEKQADSLVLRLLTSCSSAGNWTQGVEAALAELGAFASAEPLLANAVIAETRVAEGAVLKKRTEVLATLADAMDKARRESPLSPPPIAGPFVIGAIEGALVGALARGALEEFHEALPALRYIAVATYFGPERARAESGPLS